MSRTALIAAFSATLVAGLWLFAAPDRAAAAAGCDQADNPAVPVQYITCRFTDDRGRVNGPVLGEGWVRFPINLSSNTTGVAMVYGQWDDLVVVQFNGYDLVRQMYFPGNPTSSIMCWPLSTPNRSSDADVAVPRWAFWPGMTNYLDVNVADACGEFRTFDIQLQVTHTVITGPPTMTLSASKNPIIRGESTTITWATTNATVIYDYQSGQVTSEVPTGSRTYTPSQTTTYSFTAGNGVDPWLPAKSITIRVNDPPTPSMNFTVNGATGSLTVPTGSPLQLAWSTQYVDSCTKTASPVRGDWTGPAQLPIGTQPIASLAQTTTFTLSCSTAPTSYRPAGWSDSKSVTVTTVGTNWLTLNTPTLDCTTNITQPLLTLTWNWVPPPGAAPGLFSLYANGNAVATNIGYSGTSASYTLPVVNHSTATYFVTTLLAGRSDSIQSNTVTYTAICPENFGATVIPPTAIVSPGNTQPFSATAVMNRVPLQLNQLGTTTQQLCQTTDDFESYRVGAKNGRIESATWSASTTGSPYIGVRGTGGNERQQLEFRKIAGSWPSYYAVYSQLLGGLPAPGSVMVSPLTSGSVSFDVKPLQVNRSLKVSLWSTWSTPPVSLAFGPTGTLWYADNSQPNPLDQWRNLGVPYRADEWQRLTLDWTPASVTLKVNGTTVASNLPYSYPSAAGPIKSLELRSGAGSGITPGASEGGNFLIDNVTYPNSCSQLTSSLSYDWLANPSVGTITSDPTIASRAVFVAANNPGTYDHDEVAVRVRYTPTGSVPFETTVGIPITIATGGAGLIRGDIHAGGDVRNLSVDSNSVVSASGEVNVTVTGSNLKISNYTPSNRLNWDEAKRAIVNQAKLLRKERVSIDQMFPVAGINGNQSTGFTFAGSVFNLNPKNGLTTDTSHVDPAKPEGTVWWVPGDLTIDRPITFYGRGTLLVEGKVTISANRIAYGANIDGTQASLGIIAACTSDAVASCAGNTDIVIEPSVLNLVGAYFSANGSVRIVADSAAASSVGAGLSASGLTNPDRDRLLHLTLDDEKLPPAYDYGPYRKYNGICYTSRTLVGGTYLDANCPAADRKGPLNRAAEFSGVNQKLTIGPYYGDQAFQGSSTLTIGSWVRVAETIPANGERSVADRTAGGSTLWSLSLTAGNHLRFKVGSAPTVEGGSALIPGQWYWVTATYDNETARVFVNGQLDGLTGSIPDRLELLYVSSSEYLTVGGPLYGTANFFKGLLDDVSVWNRALSVDEVATYYRELSGSAVSSAATPFVAEGLFVGRSIELGRANAQLLYDGRISTDTPPGFGAVPQPGIRETAP